MRLSLIACVLCLLAGRAFAQDAAASVNWQTFIDPNERAFAIQVPAGWRVRGGLRRANAVDVRSWVDAASPDGSVELFYDDPRVPVFVVPNRMLAMGGFREGMAYSPGYNQTMEVRRYFTGGQFAALWGAARIGRGCAGVRRSAFAELPGATQRIDMAYASGGVRTTIAAGYADFACTLAGSPAAGYVFAATERVHMQGQANDMWAVKALAGFIASSPRSGQAAALLAHFVASFAVDPQWAARNIGTAAAVSRIVAATGQAMADSIRERFQTAANANNANAEKFDRAIRGTSEFVDPSGTHYYGVDTTHPYHWVGPGHLQPVPTDQPDPPFPGAVPLREVPAGQ